MDSLYNPFQYASGWQSDITNFTHFGQRWYAPLPEYGRWTQQDPVAGNLGNPISQCRYAYASDDPVNLTDRSGQSAFGCAVAQAGAILGSIWTVLTYFSTLSIITGWVAAGLIGSGFGDFLVGAVALLAGLTVLAAFIGAAVYCVENP